MKIVRFSLILIGICISLFLMGCSSYNAVSVSNVEGAELINTSWNQRDHESIAVASSANDFAFRISAALVGEIGHENFVVSPYSIWMPLAALVNVTDEQYKLALLDALGAGGINPEDINRAASRMLFDLTNESARRAWMMEEDHLQIANAIFVDNNVTLCKEFAQTFMDFYRGTLMNVDFRSPRAIVAVNQWANDNTNGLITEIVQQFDPYTVAAIANAIYFSDQWSVQFDPSKTERDIFYSPVGESFAYYMQLEKPNFTYFEDERIQVVDLSFATGGGMKIILPKDGDAVGFLSTMTNEYFERIQRDSVIAEGRLLLPRFSINNTVLGLKDVLIAMGVPLFDELAAPIVGFIEEDYRLYLSDAIQVSMIEVDEKGATAAAVTKLTIALRGLPYPTTTFEMICNTPFVFILHRPTVDGGRQVLFTGVVNQP